MSVVYKVVEAAKILGFNERTIRRDIAGMTEDVRAMSVECPTDVRHMSVTEYGLKWLADKHNVTLEVPASEADSQTDRTDTSESELVHSLLEQLRQKDLQIAEKDKQIAQLMEQAKNFQVLLQSQQVLTLPAPKQSFFKRLFGCSSDK